MRFRALRQAQRKDFRAGHFGLKLNDRDQLPAFGSSVAGESGIMPRESGARSDITQTASVRASLNNIEVWPEPGASKFRSGKWTYFFLPRDFR